MNIRRSIGEDTFDIGPGAKIWMAAEFGSRVGVGVIVRGSGIEGISDGVDAGSEAVAAISGVGDGSSVEVGVGDDGISVRVVDGCSTRSGNGVVCFVNSIGDVTAGGVPQLHRAAPERMIKARRTIRLIIIFPPADFWAAGGECLESVYRAVFLV